MNTKSKTLSRHKTYGERCVELGVSDGYGSYVCVLPVDTSAGETEAAYQELERKHQEDKGII